MESKQFIKIAVENEFETTNDRNMVKAFLYRIVLNINPLDVGRDLNLSRNQINVLTRSIDYRRLQNKEFNTRFTRIVTACQKQCWDRNVRRHQNHLTDVKNRIKTRLQTQ